MNLNPKKIPSLSGGQKQTIVFASVFIIVLVVVIPLIKGLSKGAKGIGEIITVGGDILSAPGRLIDALNKDVDNSVRELLFKAVIDYASKNVYNASNTNDGYKISVLKQYRDKGLLTNSQYNAALTHWKKPFPPKTWYSGNYKLFTF